MVIEKRQRTEMRKEMKESTRVNFDVERQRHDKIVNYTYRKRRKEREKEKKGERDREERGERKRGSSRRGKRRW